ncbi:glycosyltransferase family 2 protein [Pseudomonas sp. KSR10]|uniref:glycosyltransferase family 2 protein n=1 Tax=Pseudomonas sp. KSR10 TaxID=2916654 RepID=UPI001E4DB2E8|nr:MULTISPECIES: glycosyltransferase family 2 protein [Pseudomonadaceae]MCG6539520.1 glycosyltransferase family 2 protein [Pseudomonas sp. KSR10]
MSLAVDDDWFKPCAVVPVYNHERSLPSVVRALLAEDLHCVLVDDASRPAAAQVIDELAQHPSVHLLRHDENQGKGAAVASGLREAYRLGFSHALQVDADGQHDLEGVALFLDRASQAPDALVCGYPEYDSSVPKSRLYGRYLTHVWVWINTLSLSIRDSMCGFRVYPLQPTLALLDSTTLGQRMDFDTEILVRLHWREQPMVWLPTRVHYPADGISHFRLWRDNLLISSMHARLFGGMLLRAPALLRRRWRG